MWIVQWSVQWKTKKGKSGQTYNVLLQLRHVIQRPQLQILIISENKDDIGLLFMLRVNKRGKEEEDQQHWETPPPYFLHCDGVFGITFPLSFSPLFLPSFVSVTCFERVNSPPFFPHFLLPNIWVKYNILKLQILTFQERMARLWNHFSKILIWVKNITSLAVHLSGKYL